MSGHGDLLVSGSGTPSFHILRFPRPDINREFAESGRARGERRQRQTASPYPLEFGMDPPAFLI
jgi:hypothetical protein